MNVWVAQAERRAPAAQATVGLGLGALRRRLRWYSVAADVVVALASYELALVVFGWIHDAQLHWFTHGFDWGLPLAVAAIIVTFVWLGLYKVEAYVARPLHVATLFKGTLIALVVTAFCAFAFKSPINSDSRLTVFTFFAVFFVVSAVVRVALLDRFYVADARANRGGSIVIGLAADSSVIASRCRELRGFAPVLALEPLDRRRNGYDAEAALLDALSAAEPAPRHVFLDGASVGHKATFDLIAAARARGADVYVTGRLVSPLDTTHMLNRLFEMPLMRVRHDPAAEGGIPASKRAFDIVTSVVALVVLAPVFAALAIMVKRDSPGPVFYRQVRVGLGGQKFDFYKLRSMTVDNDPSVYREVTRQFISDSAVAAVPCSVDQYCRPIYKLADDDRVTRVGRFLRKYSLDELPQFWNVLKGDMSIVGPRPALAFEVAAYKPWHARRLEVAPGVSGLWQIAGRCRVSFDEMVFQDVMYSYNQSPLTDVSICLRTIPATLFGRGAV